MVVTVCAYVRMRYLGALARVVDKTNAHTLATPPESGFSGSWPLFVGVMMSLVVVMEPVVSVA